MTNKTNIFKLYPSNFWWANAMELFERWAWYGFFMVFSLYIVGSTDEGGLGLSSEEKGQIMGYGTGILYLLPILTGAIADKYGYRRMLIISFVIYVSAFVSIGHLESFNSVFAIYLVLALGAALFKPIIAATVTKTTNAKTSSIGFGIYYMMVNIGALIAPLVSAKLRQASWFHVFYFSAFIIALNFIIALFFFKEPEREIKKESLSETITTIFKNIFTTLKDYKFAIFLLLVAGFWTMYNQLFFTLPVFIDEWVDTRSLYNALHALSPWLAETLGTPNATIAPEIITDFDAFCIVLFQITISKIVMRFKPLSTMFSGFIIASIGMGLALFTQNPFFILFALFIFSIGEMSSSPKITEYIGKIAPKNKVALYIGCSFLPMALGNMGAGYISGSVYGKLSEKQIIIQTEMIERGYQIPEITASFTKNDFEDWAAAQLNLNKYEFTKLLWDKYNPSKIWLVITGIGFITALLLFLYDKFLLKSKSEETT